MHLRYPIHDREIFFPIINLQPQALRIHHIFLYNICYCFGSFNIGITSISNMSNFLQNDFNIVSLADNSYVVSGLVNGNKDIFFMHFLEILHHIRTFEDLLSPFRVDTLFKGPYLFVNLSQNFIFPGAHLFNWYILSNNHFLRTGIHTTYDRVTTLFPINWSSLAIVGTFLDKLPEMKIFDDSQISSKNMLMMMINKI